MEESKGGEIEAYSSKEPTLLARKRSVVKRAIIGNMAGTSDSGNDGLIHKTLKVLETWLGSNDENLQKEAIDKVIKLLPYAADKEVLAERGAGPGGKTVNIQINTFDDFLKNRLSNTNLGGMIQDVINKADAVDVDVVEEKEEDG